MQLDQPTFRRLDGLRLDLQQKVLAGLWPWEWRLLGSACPGLLRIVRSSDDKLLKLLPGEWFHVHGRLRRFIVGAAGRGERRWILALASADPSAVDTLFLLHAVCRGVHLEAAQMLLRIGADVDLQDSEGCRPLHLLAGSSSDAGALVKALSEAEADLNAASGSRGRRPLILAAVANSVQTSQALIECRAELELTDTDGRTPLASAAAVGAADTLRLLLTAGGSLGGRRLALHEAARRGHFEAATALLEAGAPVDAECASLGGGTALHLACRAGSAEMARLLLQWRAEANAVNEKGQTPLGLAFQASQAGGAARSSFRDLRAALVAAGAGLGEFNPTLYG
mmetsp:Transcript_26451/g.46831  ORF Transcript_26451/g.46831 Transcript_26451/m.46831 type:complete len:340 (+) Transcript_26451:169-1188(+)